MFDLVEDVQAVAGIANIMAFGADQGRFERFPADAAGDDLG